PQKSLRVEPCFDSRDRLKLGFGLARLEELDRVAGWVLEQDLFAAYPSLISAGRRFSFAHGRIGCLCNTLTRKQKRGPAPIMRACGRRALRSPAAGLSSSTGTSPR